MAMPFELVMRVSAEVGLLTPLCTADVSVSAATGSGRPSAVATSAPMAPNPAARIARRERGAVVSMAIRSSLPPLLIGQVVMLGVQLGASQAAHRGTDDRSRYPVG